MTWIGGPIRAAELLGALERREAAVGHGRDELLAHARQVFRDAGDLDDSLDELGVLT